MENGSVELCHWRFRLSLWKLSNPGTHLSAIYMNLNKTQTDNTRNGFILEHTNSAFLWRKLHLNDSFKSENEEGIMSIKYVLRKQPQFVPIIIKAFEDVNGDL